MNPNINSSTSLKVVTETSDDPSKITSVPQITVQSVAKIMFVGGSKSRQRNGEQFRMEALDPIKRKERRILGLKRHVRRLSDDLRYHPKKLDVMDITQKKNKLDHELSKQEAMIKTQGQDLTKKYQLLHSDLGKLLRSASEGNGSGSNSDSPRQVLTLSA